MNKQQAFSLVELLIVMVIVGILAAVAIPSYTNNVKKTRRNMAAACLQENAQYLERWYTTKMTYEDATKQDCEAGVEDFYTVTVEVTGPREFSAQAVPKAGQANDKCGTMTINEKGLRTSTGTGNGCWS